MGKRRRRSATGRTANGGRESRGLSHRPGVWLGTVSTVVAIATGMFTLRDQVFRTESGTAGAVAESSYRVHVGDICDELNEADAARARGDVRLARELKRARTNLAQRDALLDAVRRTTTRSDHALSMLGGLEPPDRYAQLHQRIEALWKRNLGRLLVYTDRLDRVANRPDLVAAVVFLSRNRTALHDDGRTVDTGLGKLGSGNCRLEPARVTRTITLPPLGKPDRVRPRLNSKPKQAAGPTAPAPQASAPAPRLNTPAPAQPRVNTPHAAAPAPSPGPRVNTPGDAGAGAGAGGGP